MAAVDFLHHENPPTWAGVETANLGAEGQRQTNHAIQPAVFTLVLKVADTWLERYEFEPSTAEDPPCKQEMLFKSVEAQNPPVAERLVQEHEKVKEDIEIPSQLDNGG
ncbi:hypothetical protein TNCV_5045891 [Trichonephila clavipes]|uniref:Uncharacterized protein n=1 Tax=Trichonephila clavipes TaxID=2585209 RepID=A0A8X6WI56_TRICX|nr:hypothetical protein TNCV_5045891 [Trichonephila clavipes]